MVGPGISFHLHAPHTRPGGERSRRIHDASPALPIIGSRQTEEKTEKAPPALPIRPIIPPKVTVLTGFARTAELIASDGEATIEALPHMRG
jgi:hypothetical protein